MDLAELGQLADKLDAIRAKRIIADKIAASLKSNENQIKAVIITEMEESNLSSVGGKICVLNRAIKKRPIAGDWPKIHEYIRKNDAFDLLHKRLTESAVLLRLDDEVKIPGVNIMEYSHITFAKAKT